MLRMQSAAVKRIVPGGEGAPGVPSKLKAELKAAADELREPREQAVSSEDSLVGLLARKLAEADEGRRMLPRTCGYPGAPAALRAAQERVGRGARSRLQARKGRSHVFFSPPIRLEAR